MWLLLVCCCSALGMQALVTQSLSGFSAPNAIVTVANATGMQSNTHSLPGLGDGALLACFASLPKGRAAVCTLNSNAQSCIALFDVLTGASLIVRCQADLVLDNMAFDVALNTLFVGAYNMTSQSNHVFSIDYNNAKSAPFVNVVNVPGIVNVGVSAYSQRDHLFFLTQQTDSSSENSLIVVDMAARKVRTIVNVPQSIEVFVYDDSRAALYAWCATEMYAAALYTVNQTSGMTGATPIWASQTLSANGGSAVFDAAHRTVLSSLLLFGGSPQYPQEWPYWVTVNVDTGASTRTATPATATYPWIVALYA